MQSERLFSSSEFHDIPPEEPRRSSRLEGRPKINYPADEPVESILDEEELEYPVESLVASQVAAREVEPKSVRCRKKSLLKVPPSTRKRMDDLGFKHEDIIQCFRCISREKNQKFLKENGFTPAEVHIILHDIYATV